MHTLRELQKCGSLLLGRTMAKPFAEKLYNSKAWHRVREAAIVRDRGLCQREGCYKPAEEVHHIIELTPANVDDPRIALNLDNLMCVCRDCHFKIHREKILERYRRKARKRILNKDGFYFDAEGLLTPMKVYIVHGAPAAGKSRYVREHRETTDLVVDLDSIQQALGHDRNDPHSNMLDLSISIRDYIYDRIEARDGSIDCRNVWVIATLPKKKQRLELARRLRAELIHIDTLQETCIEYAKADEKRFDKQLQVAIIEEYFEKFQP